MAAAKMKKSEVLNDLVAALVKGWGLSAVYKALEDLTPVDERDKWKSKSFHALQSPIEQVDALGIEDSVKREELIAIAKEFEEKSFLPTVGAAKKFLILRGLPADKVKTRAAGFRLILPVLTEMSADTLKRERRKGSRLAPASLGPLSDAITETGRSFREERQDGREGLSESSISKRS